MKPVHYSAPPSVSHNGFLFKTASMARAVTERKSREGNCNIQIRNIMLHILPSCRPNLFALWGLHVEFSRRWCTLNDGTFSYYESDKNSNPNGALKASEVVCLAVDVPEKHGYVHTN